MASSSCSAPAGWRCPSWSARQRACAPREGKGKLNAANVYYEEDADPSLIAGRKVAIIGYGSQGHAHALNLKDSGVDVRVGLREGSSSTAKAEAAGPRGAVDRRGRRPRPTSIMMLLPDTEQKRDRTTSDIAPNLTPGDALAFAHGFNIRFGRITPPEGVDVVMVAPEGPGPPRAPHLHRGRRRAVPDRRRAGRHRQGHGRWRCRTPTPSAAPAPACIETTFAEETETDLFGEQVVLCGGLTVARAGRASRRSSRPATSRRWRTSSASTR